MDGERDKASENPYQAPIGQRNRAFGCTAAALCVVILCSVALTACVFLWLQLGSEFELVGISVSSGRLKIGLVATAVLAMAMIAGLLVYLRHFAGWPNA